MTDTPTPGQGQPVVMSGATGLIGSALRPLLLDHGHEVRALVRRTPRGSDILWDPAAGTLDPAALEGVDAVIHLSGESVAQPWTPEAKRAIRDSRVNSTHLLARTLAGLEDKPSVFIVASATGYYGDRGDEVLTEESAPGTGFLADVCREWEAAADPARQAGIRVVHVRTGVVLTARGGALPRMLPPFRMGAGGPIGGGRQWLSWISLADITGLYHHALHTGELVGPVNGVAPNPVTNAEFASALGRALGRPAFMPIPAFAVRAMFGQMAEETVLASQRILPQKALATGFQFQHPDLPATLRAELAA